MKPLPEDADTVPITTRRDARASAPAERVAPGERAEIVIEVVVSMWKPTLYLTTGSQTLIVESVLCGQICLNRTPKYARDYEKGLRLFETVSPTRPLKVVVMNPGTVDAIVSARIETKIGE
jgi:hypothetical protein